MFIDIKRKDEKYFQDVDIYSWLEDDQRIYFKISDATAVVINKANLKVFVGYILIENPLRVLDVHVNAKAGTLTYDYTGCSNSDWFYDNQGNIFCKYENKYTCVNNPSSTPQSKRVRLVKTLILEIG